MDETERFETVDRRRLLSRLGVIAAGGAAVVAADTVLAGNADATVGTMHFGAGNNAGADATDLSSSSTGATLRVHNTDTVSGKALFADATGNAAIWGETIKNQGVVGVANAPGGTDGVYGGSHATTAGAGAGVHGHHYTGDNPGVLGTIGAKSGFVGSPAAVQGDSASHAGVAGLSTNGPGVIGDSTNSYGGQFGGNPSGVLGAIRAGTAGVEGQCGGGTGSGVLGRGLGTGGNGVRGVATAANGTGVRGESDHGSGVLGIASAVSGFSVPRAGVLGDSHDTAGVAGMSKNYIGVIGSADTEAGVAGSSNSSDGVRGTSKTGAGVTGIATAQGGAGVHAVAKATGTVALLASIENNVTGASALGVQGAALFTGPNTLAGSTKITGTANFTGKTQFSRSGFVTIAAGHKTATATSIDLTSDSLVIATVQSGSTTNAVAAATPNVSGSSIKITLQKNATAATKVAYFVIG